MPSPGLTGKDQVDPLEVSIKSTHLPKSSPRTKTIDFTHYHCEVLEDFRLKFYSLLTRFSKYFYCEQGKFHVLLNSGPNLNVKNVEKDLIEKRNCIRILKA